MFQSIRAGRSTSHLTLVLVLGALFLAAAAPSYADERLNMRNNSTLRGGAVDVRGDNIRFDNQCTGAPRAYELRDVNDVVIGKFCEERTLPPLIGVIYRSTLGAIIDAAQRRNGAPLPDHLTDSPETACERSEGRQFLWEVRARAGGRAFGNTIAFARDEIQIDTTAVPRDDVRQIVLRVRRDFCASFSAPSGSHHSSPAPSRSF